MVVAANGVGTPRLLLLSRSRRFRDGLANSSGLVGKRLMIHPCRCVTGVYDEELESWRGPFGASIVSQRVRRVRPDRGLPARRALGPRAVGGPPRFSMVPAGHEHLPLATRWGADFHRSRARLVGRTSTWRSPRRTCRTRRNDVTLDPELTDADGIPAPRIRYRTSRDVTREPGVATRAAPARRTRPPAPDASTSNRPLPHGGWHLLGTARMGDDPATSVVDR